MDFSNLIQSIKGKFSGKKKYEIFLDYIENIHFPFYKGLERNSTIEFKFPLTVLVGENGCGKSSVLQALENAAAGKSLSQRWFSTSVDPIPDGERPCFWYSYYSKEADKVVQILNTRIKKKNGKLENPDYWEPSRPVTSYGMDSFDKTMANKPGASGTRWNGTKRKIEYIDFREEISAFDKYFYFEDDPWNKTKQEYIRQYSKYLKLAIDGRYSKSRNLYRKPRLRSVVELTETEVSVLSEILDKQYSSVKIIEHQFYKKWGTSVYFTQKNRDEFFSGCYSEAFAGSGESAVAKLVHKIYEADNATLLLLDEPEVSLHPGAQKRLLKFILENVRDKGLQVVISTHSPAIVEELPSEAIVVMNQNEGKKFSPIQNVSADIAFQYIGHTNVNKKRIIVEDDVAREIVLKVLRHQDPKAVDSVNVIYHAGGAKDIFKEAVILSRLKADKTFLFLDGDQKKEIPKETDVAESALDQVIQKITGVEPKNLGFVADSGKEKFQLIKEKRDFLCFLKTHCDFLPMGTPEEILWKCSSQAPKDVVDGTKKDAYKRAIKNWASKDLGCEAKADDIKTYLRKLCNGLNMENENMKLIIEILKRIIE